MENGGTVRLINVNGYADKFPRKEIDKLGEFVKTYRAKGLAWMKLAADGSMTSSFAKFLSEDEIAAIKERAGAKENDLLFVVADADWQTAAVALGALRCELAKRLGLAKKDDFKLLWVTEFPQFEYSEEENRLVAMHHPFTAPMDEDIPLLDTDPAKVRAKAYDIILNGCELAAAPFVSTTPSFRPGCSRRSASPRRRPRSSSATSSLRSLTAHLRTAASLTVLTVCACCSPVWTPSATLSPSQRFRTHPT